MQKSISKIKIVAVVLLIAVAMGFIIYNYYPKINQTMQKDKIIAVAKENTELKDALNAALAVLQENGTIDTLLEKHDLLEDAE